MHFYVIIHRSSLILQTIFTTESLETIVLLSEGASLEGCEEELAVWVPFFIILNEGVGLC